MDELSKITFISPGLSKYGEAGHFSTLHRSLEIGCLENGIDWSISEDPRLGPKEAFQEVNHDLAALVYEGDLRLLRDIAIGPLDAPVYFNFLKSNDYLLMWLFLRLKGHSKLDSTKALMNDLIKAGWVFSADTENLRTRLVHLGFPIQSTFPFSSAFSGRRDFSQSEWQLGMMAETKIDWIVNLITARLVSLLRPGISVKLLNAHSSFYPPGTYKKSSLLVTSLPATGQEYLDRLSAKYWFLPGRSSHHVFGSSGRSLDILANRGVVFTRRFNSLGDGSLNAADRCFRSAFPRLKAIMFTLRQRAGSEGAVLPNAQPDRTAQQTISSIQVDLLQAEKMLRSTEVNAQRLDQELQEFETFCAERWTNLLFRILLRLPRRMLWKLTDSDLFRRH